MGWLSDTWESVKENASDICHGVLDVAGFIPVLGAVPDLLNAGIYALEGNAVDAGMSLVAAIPGVGDIGAAVGKGGKYLFKGGKWLLGKGKKLFKGGGKLLKALKKNKFLGKLGNLLGKMKVGAKGKALFNKGKEKGKALFDKITSKFKRGCKDGNGCFVENTLVWTEKGLKNIQEIKKGELIYSKDEKKGKVGLKQVKRVFESKVHTIYTIQIEDTEEVQTTNYHPFYVKDKGWVCAIQLQVGDELCTIEGDIKKVTSVEKKRWEDGVYVYNFEVEDWVSYFVSELGVYVHNTIPCGKPKKKSKPKKKNNKGNPVHKVSRSEYPNHTKMLENAKKDGHSFKNLERGAGTKAAKKNRYESQKKLRKSQGGPPKGYDYDEFPYASTTQGGKNAHVEPVPSAENQAAGRDLGTFYRENDIKPGDKFDIEIVD